MAEAPPSRNDPRFEALAAQMSAAINDIISAESLLWAMHFEMQIQGGKLDRDTVHHLIDLTIKKCREAPPDSEHPLGSGRADTQLLEGVRQKLLKTDTTPPRRWAPIIVPGGRSES